MDRKELRKQVTQSVTTETRDEIRQAWSKFAAITLGVFAVVLAILSFVMFQRGTETVEETPMEKQEEGSMSLDEMALLARESADGFLNGTTVLEKAQHVMEPRRVMPLMERYYEKHPMETLKFRDFSNEKYHVAGNREFLIATVIFSDSSRAMWVFEANDEGKVKLQWEVAVGYSDKDWEAFIADRDEDPTTFRVMLEYLITDPYYNFDFVNQEKYSCFRLRHPLSDEEIFGYLDKSTEAHESFIAVRLISELPAMPVIVTLRYLPDGQPNQVVIDDIKSFSWIDGVDM